MISTMPMVFAEILSCELRKDETHATIESYQLEVLVKEDYIENQCGDPQDHAQDKIISSTHPEYKENEGDLYVQYEECE